MIRDLLIAFAPLLLAALAALLSEKAGALAVFIEGLMTIGAFAAWTLATASSSAYLGMLGAILAGAACAWLLARFVQASGANPFLAGLALNLLASAATETLSVLIYGTKGVLNSPALPPLPSLLFAGDFFLYPALASLALLGFLLTRSRWGLRLLAAGNAPDELRQRGIEPSRYRAMAWAIAGALAALAGAALSYRVGAWVPGGVAGRGWLALAAVYLGFKRVPFVALAVLSLCLVEQLGHLAQARLGIPATALLGLPALLALGLYLLASHIKETTE